MYKLVFAPEFIKDLDNTFDYISAVLTAPNAAKALMKKIDYSILKLKEMPYMYPLCSEPLDSLGYRKIIVENYIVVYSVDEKFKTVNVLRSFYGKRQYINFFK